MSSQWLSESQVLEMLKLIDRLGKFQMNTRVAPVFGGVATLRRYFDVRESDGKIELTRKTWNDTLDQVRQGSTYYENYCTSVSSGAITINGNTTTATCMVATHPEGTRMEHHIARERLIEVVTENMRRYVDRLAHLKELYEAELAEKLHAHMEGEISQNQIVVLDKMGCKFELPIDRSDIYDTMLRELDLDVREVIILDDQEYGSMVENTSSNLRSIEESIKMLEER